MHLIIFLLFSFLSGYPSQGIAQKHTTILAQFEAGVPGDSVYIESTEGIRYTSMIDQNKSISFRFKPTINDIYFIRYPSLYPDFMYPIFVQEGTTVKFRINKSLNDVEFTGDELATEQNAFYSGMTDYYDTYIKTQNKIDTTKDTSELSMLQQRMLSIQEDYQNYYLNWVENHKGSPFSAAVILLYVQNGSENDTIAARCFNMLHRSATTNNYAAWTLATKLSRLIDSVSIVPTDTQAPDFNLSDTAGNEIRLSDFKGKYLLIDFWASWCAPCRVNNPLLKEVYEKYKDKGLELLSISIDTDNNAWKNAIVKDGLYWANGNDFKKNENNGVAFNYGIYGVPYYVLVDPSQNVIFKSSGGDVQKTIQKLEEVLSD